MTVLTMNYYYFLVVHKQQHSIKQLLKLHSSLNNVV